MAEVKKLELVEVKYDGPKAVLVFLDKEEGLIRQVKFNKQVYDRTAKKWVDDEKKAEQVETWCRDLLGVTFDTLSQAIGSKKDVYIYDQFNSLYEVQLTDKFEESMLGDILIAKIESIEDTGTKISVKYQYEEKLYESKFQYASYIESLKEWFVDPNDRQSAYAKFEERFSIPFDRKDELIGEPITIEVKKAGGKWLYGDMKKRKVK